MEQFAFKISEDGVISAVIGDGQPSFRESAKGALSPIGRAWAKKARSGRVYYKMKFDALRTAAGRPLYAEAWSRRSDPNKFDIYAETTGCPILNLVPSFADMIAKLKSTTAMPSVSLLGV